MRSLALLLCLLSSAALADDHNAGHAKYHADFYSKWQTKEGGSCCSSNDCRPIDDKDFRFKGEVLEVRIGDNWISVPSDKIRPYVAPDMSSHLCHLGNSVFCFVFGGGT